MKTVFFEEMEDSVLPDLKTNTSAILKEWYYHDIID